MLSLLVYTAVMQAVSLGSAAGLTLGNMGLGWAGLGWTNCENIGFVEEVPLCARE